AQERGERRALGHRLSARGIPAREERGEARPLRQEAVVELRVAARLGALEPRERAVDADPVVLVEVRVGVGIAPRLPHPAERREVERGGQDRGSHRRRRLPLPAWVPCPRPSPRSSGSG
ncbi:MAG: hypothetical protein ACK559_38130, partial [bacterium]